MTSHTDVYVLLTLLTENLLSLEQRYEGMKVSQAGGWGSLLPAQLEEPYLTRRSGPADRFPVSGSLSNLPTRQSHTINVTQSPAKNLLQTFCNQVSPRKRYGSSVSP